MTAALRKIGLTAHVTLSVAWLGAVSSFLVLSIAGLTSNDAEIVRGAYLAMNLIGLYTIVPLSLAALVTGLVQSLGTHWGVFRFYWVATKLVLTIFATTALLLHQFTAVAGAARRVSGIAAGTLPDVGGLGIQLVADSGLALVVLLVITTLAVLKPWGRTAYGRRRQLEERRDARAEVPMSIPPALPDPRLGTTGDRLPLGLRIFLAVIGVLVTLFMVLHLAVGGLGSHGH